MDENEMNNSKFEQIEENNTPSEEIEVKIVKKDKYKTICFILLLFLFASFGYIVGSFRHKENDSEVSLNTSLSSVSATTIKNTKLEEVSLADLIDLIDDSVVEIATETVVKGSIMRQYISEGAGSGVIVKEDGYIITNYHVIEGANKIKITLKNGESYEAKLIGTDSDNDVAVLKIEKDGLTAAVIGDSSVLRVGEMAIAIGNPLGELGGTVTTGIISALDREIDLGTTVMNLLQTNAAINPGNSGGALFNANGELIGITVAKSSGSDVEGLGFAIPINDVKEVVNDILNYGYVKGKIQIGVNLLDVTSVYEAMMYGVDSTGLYVQSVVEGSSAEKAGIKAGDRIVEFAGEDVSSVAELKKVINKSQVGETVNIVVVRNGREKELKVYLSEYKGE